MVSHSCASTIFTVLFVLAGLVLAALPVAIWFYWENYRDRVQPHTLAWLIASCFLGVTLPISIWEIVMHLRYMHVPLLQVPVVRVLWMVPIYAFDSWLALRFSMTKGKDISSYICVARECYEAFVVYNFFLFLARYVAISAARDRRRPARTERECNAQIRGRGSGESQIVPEHGRQGEEALDASLESGDGSAAEHSQDALVRGQGQGRDSTRSSDSAVLAHDDSHDGSSLASGNSQALTQIRAIEARLRGVLARKPPIEHISPLNLILRPWATSSTAHHDSCEYYRRIKGGVVQYVVVKLGCALAAFVMKPIGIWGEGTFDATRGFFWAAMLTNLSQGWALYCLVLFYKGLHNELAPMKPLAKFMSVKALVFFSFWQSLVIALLVRQGVIQPSEMYPETADLAAATQDFLICLEMLLFSLVHHWVFSYRQFAPEYPTQTVSRRPHPSAAVGAPEPSSDTRDFARAMKAMIAFDDVWMDTRGTLTPILPKKPYPIMRVPPPVAGAAGVRSGRRSAGTSRAGSDWSGPGAHEERDLPASLRDSPDEGRGSYLQQQLPTPAAIVPSTDAAQSRRHEAGEHQIENAEHEDQGRDCSREGGRGPAEARVRSGGVSGRAPLPTASGPESRGPGSFIFGWRWKGGAAGEMASSTREPLLQGACSGGDLGLDEDLHVEEAAGDPQNLRHADAESVIKGLERI